MEIGETSLETLDVLIMASDLILVGDRGRGGGYVASSSCSRAVTVDCFMDCVNDDGVA